MTVKICPDATRDVTTSMLGASRRGIIDPTLEPATEQPTANLSARARVWDELTMGLTALVENLNDIEQARIAASHRILALARDMGAEAGQGIDEVTPLLIRAPVGMALLDHLAHMAAVEHRAELAIGRELRNRHPLAGWVSRSVGVGEKQAARLFGAIGNPYWNTLDDRPRRGPAELWAYCGFHVLPASQRTLDVHTGRTGGQPRFPGDGQDADDARGAGAVPGEAPRRRKGMRANWSTAARMRAWLIAGSCVKQRAGTYRPVYDAGRLKYAGAVHAAPCPRCGPEGKPAQPGSPLSDGHAHARALRLVAKAVLRDLWLEARAWHLEP